MMVSSNYGTIAIKIDGTLWGWGQNTTGGLGVGDAIKRSSPVQIGTLATWSSLSGGNGQTLAIKTDRTLWGWGSNLHGYIGLGDVVHRSSPVQIGTLASWIKIAAGDGSLGIHC